MLQPLSRQRRPWRDRPPVAHPAAKVGTGGPREGGTEERLTSLEREILRIKTRLNTVLARIGADDIAPLDGDTAKGAPGSEANP